MHIHPSNYCTNYFFTTPQVTHFGCKSFALLFDDIDHNMCPADKEVFSSFAQAQVSITNEIYQYLGEPETFLFCPTGTSEVHQNYLHVTKMFYVTMISVVQIQSTVELFATQMSLSLPTSVQ